MRSFLVTTVKSPRRSVLVFSSCAMRSFSEDMSCWTDCSAVFSWAVSVCWLLSSLDEAFQPNPRPPRATKPTITIAESCQDGPLLLSISWSSYLFDHLSATELGQRFGGREP